jgi:hypothetical protein
VRLGFPLTRSRPSDPDPIAPVGAGAGSGQLAGRQCSVAVLVVLAALLSSPCSVRVRAPMYAGVRRRPPADGRPSKVGGGEP